MDLEILFFKVIRNVVIFRKIFSNINEYSIFKYGVYKYHQIISVEDMIENKNFNGLLKYKVKRNEHLSFTYFKLVHVLNNGIINYQVITKPLLNLNDRIFSTIRDDQEFYHCLFKFYHHQFENDLSKDNIKSTINKIIENDCLGGLKELIDNFNFGKLITEKHLLLAFNFNSFKVLEHLSGEINVIPSKFYDEIKKNTPNHKVFEYNFNKFSSISSMKFLNINDQIGFLVNVLGYIPPNNNNNGDISNLVYSISKDIRVITIQQLIESCITVSFLYIPLKQYIKSVKEYLESRKESLVNKYNHQKEIIDLYLNINEDEQSLSSLSIDEIKIIKSKFTNEQLSTKLGNTEKIGNQDELCKLFKCILPFIGYGKWLYTNLRYYYQKFIKQIHYLDEPSYFSSNDIIYSYFKISNSNQENHKYLLKIINEIKMDLHCKNINPMPLYKSIIELFIEKEDYKCLETILDLMSPNDIPNNLLLHVNSETMLQYLNNHVNSQRKVLELIEKNLKNLHLPNTISIYKSLYPNEFQLMISKNIISVLNFVAWKSSYLVECYNCLQDKENEDMCWFIYNCNELSKQFIPISNLQQTLSYKQFKFFFENTFYSDPPYQQLSYSDKLVYIEFSQNEKSILFHYLCNNYIVLFNNPTFFFQNSKLLFSIVSQYGDIEFLSILLSTFFQLHLYTNNLQFIPFLNTIYVYSSYFNQISIINYIQQNYSHIFSEIDQKTINFCVDVPKMKKSQNCE